MKNIYFHGMRFYFYCSLFIVSLSLGLEKLLVTGSEGFPGGSGGKESACNAGDVGLIPGSGRSPGGGNGNSLQYSCLENPIDRGVWWAIVHGVTESDTTEVTKQQWRIISNWGCWLILMFRAVCPSSMNCYKSQCPRAP